MTLEYLKQHDMRRGGYGSPLPLHLLLLKKFQIVISRQVELSKDPPSPDLKFWGPKFDHFRTLLTFLLIYFLPLGILFL